MILNKSQENAYHYICSGFSVFITGGGGVGKTALLNYYIKNHKKKTLGVTSTTGTSAILINGSTLHSYLGLGIKINTNTKENLLNYIKKTKNIKKRKKIYNTDILIIDECSMLSCQILDKMEYIFRKIKSCLHLDKYSLVMSTCACYNLHHACYKFRPKHQNPREEDLKFSKHPNLLKSIKNSQRYS